MIYSILYLYYYYYYYYKVGLRWPPGNGLPTMTIVVYAGTLSMVAVLSARIQAMTVH